METIAGMSGLIGVFFLLGVWVGAFVRDNAWMKNAKASSGFWCRGRHFKVNELK